MVEVLGADFFGADLGVVGFLAVVGLVLGVGFVVFLADLANFMPADLAILARADLRREAVFFFIKSFLTALSYSD